MIGWLFRLLRVWLVYEDITQTEARESLKVASSNLPIPRARYDTSDGREVMVNPRLKPRAIRRSA